MTRSDRVEAEARGRRAERHAAFWLRLKGYRVLATRARTPAGEIDLIARRGRILAFIEVKARPGREQALYAVSPRQARRIVQAAAFWRARRPGLQGLQPRFDVVLLAPGRAPRHVRGAFMIDPADAARLL
jgi:putative endonuclease